MSVIVDTAKDVVKLLNENNFSMDFTAFYEPLPRQDLQSVKRLEVFVTPDSCEWRRVTREAWTRNPVIQVGVLKHIDKIARHTEVPDLLQLVEEISACLTKGVLEHQDVKIVRVSNDPLYHYEHLNQFSCFTSVVSAEYVTGTY